MTVRTGEGFAEDRFDATGSASFSLSVGDTVASNFSRSSQSSICTNSSSPLDADFETSMAVVVFECDILEAAPAPGSCIGVATIGADVFRTVEFPDTIADPPLGGGLATVRSLRSPLIVTTFTRVLAFEIADALAVGGGLSTGSSRAIAVFDDDFSVDLVRAIVSS